MNKPTFRVVLLLSVLLVTAHQFSNAEPLPDVRIKIYCSMGTPPAELASWGYGAGDSLADFKKALLDRQEWIQVVQTPEEADLNVMIMGRDRSSRVGYEDLYLVWIVIQKESDYYSLFGSRNSPCISCWRDASGAAAGMVIKWIKTNYEMIRQKLMIPGGLAHPTFSMPLLDVERAHTAPSGRRFKVFCDVGQTPPVYQKGWADGKSDSVKDLKEKIRKKSKFFELTDQRQNADLILEVLGRQWMFHSNVIWGQIIVAGEKISFSFPLFLATWKQTAEETVYRLDLWAEQAQGNIQNILAAAAGGSTVSLASKPGTSATPVSSSGSTGATSAKFGVINVKRIIQESAIGKQKLAELQEFKQKQLEEIKQKNLRGAEVSRRQAEIDKRMNQALTELEQSILPVIKQLGEEKAYDYILALDTLERIRSENKQAVVVKLQVQDVIFYNPNRPLMLDLTNQSYPDDTNEIIERFDKR